MKVAKKIASLAKRCLRIAPHTLPDNPVDAAADAACELISLHEEGIGAEVMTDLVEGQTVPRAVRAVAEDFDLTEEDIKDCISDIMFDVVYATAGA